MNTVKQVNTRAFLFIYLFIFALEVKIIPLPLISVSHLLTVSNYQINWLMKMMSLTFGLFTQVSDSGSYGPLV